MPGTSVLLMSLFNRVDLKASLKENFPHLTFRILGCRRQESNTSATEPLQPLLVTKSSLKKLRFALRHHFVSMLLRDRSGWNSDVQDRDKLLINWKSILLDLIKNREGNREKHLFVFSSNKHVQIQSWPPCWKLRGNTSVCLCRTHLCVLILP